MMGIISRQYDLAVLNLVNIYKESGHNFLAFLMCPFYYTTNYPIRQALFCNFCLQKRHFLQNNVKKSPKHEKICRKSNLIIVSDSFQFFIFYEPPTRTNRSPQASP